ncbi:MAG: hypothetical protein LH469_10730 [Frankiaceae bacterium]|nr:hypothetical protein [Frankiaceae bacterium]
MLPTIADVAVALDEERRPEHRAALEQVAVALLRLGIARWEVAQLHALLCRLALDSRTGGGDDDQRDAAAA